MPDVTQHPIYEPDGKIMLYKFIPLDKSYEHSVRYGSRTAFINALATYPNVTLNNQSYSRITQNTIRIEMPYSLAKDYNYMRINDPDLYGGKTYFCFIDTAEYVNNVTTDIFYTTDVLQTFWFDFTMGKNFVEREHCRVVEDTFGANLVPETLETGDLIIQNTAHYTYPLFNSYVAENPATWDVVIAYVANWKGADTEYVVVRNGTITTIQSLLIPPELTLPQMRNGFMSPICYLRFTGINLANLQNAIQFVQLAVIEITRAEAQVVDIFLVPTEVGSENFTVPATVTPHQFVLNRFTSFKYISKNGSYTPKNIKMFTAPFSSVVVSNGNGGIANYKWELFTSGNTNAAFGVVSAFTPEPILHLYPAQYRNINADFESGIAFEDFPKCCWSEDSHSKWWAQNKSNFSLSLATQGIMSALTLKTGGAKPEAVSAATETGEGVKKKGILSKSGAFSLGMGAIGIGRTLGSLSTATNSPDTFHSQSNIPVLAAMQNRLGFIAYGMGITGEMAEVIDDYFEMFGYATHKVKVPNYVATPRRVWDYVKLQACQIEPKTDAVGITSEAIAQIQDIFNNGITLWRDLTNVGNYTLDNHQ